MTVIALHIKAQMGARLLSTERKVCFMNCEEKNHRNMQNEYKTIKCLGHGGFGEVYLCKNRKNELVCLKKMQKDAYNTCKSEVYILSRLNHPRIIRFIDFFVTDSTVQVVIEYAPQGSLRDFLLRTRSPLPQQAVLNFFMDIVLGLEYLHIKHVIHCDLKPENLLIAGNNRIKICDFGISTVIVRNCKGKDARGTVLYIAPEILFGHSYDFQADIWSLGCVLYELCALRTPFIQTKIQLHIYEITNGCRYGAWPCDHLPYPEYLRQLCAQMLTVNPSERINLPGIIRHFIWPYYYNLYFDYYDRNSL